MANYEQLVLFDLTPYITQQSTVEEEVLGSRKVELLVKEKYIQLELDLFPQPADVILDKNTPLAA